jgi:hypothetical protein
MTTKPARETLKWDSATSFDCDNEFRTEGTTSIASTSYAAAPIRLKPFALGP